MNNHARGQILPVVMLSLVILTLIIAALVSWVQTDTKQSVYAQKNTDAVNFAEAGMDRGTWKLQSATSTWANAASGVVVSGYNFDTTYSDIPGGTYRIKLSSGSQINGLTTVTITAEGRDSMSRETRALQAVVQNQVIYSAMMSGGNVSWSAGLVVFWGPIMSQGNITLQDNTVGSMYYPRKFAKGVVSTGAGVNAIYARDTNGLLPPNTDNVEWWSEYNGVPPLPVLDFVSMRSSAAATGTLNVYGCAGTLGTGVAGSTTSWDRRAACDTVVTPHAQHFGNPWNHGKSPQFQPNTDYVWYWDNDVTLAGCIAGGSRDCTSKSTGLRGMVIVRGNLTIDTGGQYNYIGHVPTLAWQEENKLLVNTFDTAAASEYPGDLGLHSSTGAFHFGVDTFNVPGLGGGPYHTTVGIKGFTYVGKDLNIISYMDFNGAVWINGNVSASGGSASNSCGIFYDDTLQVPALNVILNRLSWKEVAPSNQAWP